MARSAETKALLDCARRGELVGVKNSGDAYWLLKAAGGSAREVSTQGSEFWYFGDTCILAEADDVDLANCVVRVLKGRSDVERVHVLKTLMRDKVAGKALLVVAHLEKDERVFDYMQRIGLV